MGRALEKAWKLFDEGKFSEAEALYLECFGNIDASDRENYNAALMGLIYVECFLGKYEAARKYGKILVEEAGSEEERHTAIHQNGMIERMAGNYAGAMELFIEEEKIIRGAFPEEFMLLAANLYEQGYVNLLMKNYDRAEAIMKISLENAMRSQDDMCIGCAYRGMGEILKATERAEEAMEYFRKATTAFRNAGDMTAVEEIESLMRL